MNERVEAINIPKYVIYVNVIDNFHKTGLMNFLKVMLLSFFLIILGTRVN